jgi:hypothetical protein
VNGRNELNERKAKTMKTMQQLGLTALALVVGALFTASPALARKPGPIVPVTYTYKLVPPEVNPPQPQASGQWTLETASLPTSSVGVDVSCRRLTPGQQYVVTYWVVWYPWFWDGEPCPTWECDTQVVMADAKGRLNAQFTVAIPDAIVTVDSLWIENDDGDVVLEEQ